MSATDPPALRLAAIWVANYKAGTHELNQWCTPSRRNDFWRGYYGYPLRQFEGGPDQAYLVGVECRKLIDEWVEYLQRWHDQH